MIEKEDFEDWLDNPVTQYFKKYLLDSAKEEEALASASIVTGAILSEREQVRISTTFSVLEGIGEINLEEIQEFYEEK